MKMILRNVGLLGATALASGSWAQAPAVPAVPAVPAAKIAMGLPAFAVIAYLVWLMHRGLLARRGLR